MDLKNVVRKIMGSSELRTRLQSLDSFDEVYDFFIGCGYEGGKSELKDKLFKNSTPFKMLDDDLANVAGGISGRQVLSACMGLMVLTGFLPDMMGLNNFGSAKSVSTSVTTNVKKDAEVSHEEILNFGKAIIDRATANYIVLMRMSYDETGTHKYGPNFDPKSNKTYNWLSGLAEAEALKIEAELFGMESNKDFSGFKSRVDKLLNETDVNSFNDEEFESKLATIWEDYPEVSLMSSSSEFNEKFTNLLDKKLSKSEKENLLKQLNKKLDDIDKKYGEMWLDEGHHSAVKLSALLSFDREYLNMDLENNIEKLVNIVGKEEVEKFRKNYL